MSKKTTLTSPDLTATAFTDYYTTTVVVTTPERELVLYHQVNHCPPGSAEGYAQDALEVARQRMAEGLQPRPLPDSWGI